MVGCDRARPGVIFCSSSGGMAVAAGARLALVVSALVTSLGIAPGPATASIVPALPVGSAAEGLVANPGVIPVSTLPLPAPGLRSPDRTWDTLDELFSSRVDEQGRVRYSGLLSDSLFVRAWDALVAVGPLDLSRWSVEDRLAFWINAYNLATLKLIADHYPIQKRFFLSLFLPSNSILMIKGRWKGNFYPLAGEERSLDQIEHDILRREFAEPRIHFAIVCASIGCPTLRREAYRGSLIESQLESQARRYFATRSGLIRDGSKLELTKILDWFGDDFRLLPADPAILLRQGGDKRAMLVARVAHWFPETVLRNLRTESLRFGWISYDWNLNEQRP